MKIYCVFSLELNHRGISNECIQYTIFIIKKKITLNYHQSAARGLKNDYETAVVKRTIGVRAMKLYCGCARGENAQSVLGNCTIQRYYCNEKKGKYWHSLGKYILPFPCK